MSSLIDTKVDPKPDSDITPLPGHVAIIMDGNGRWANARGLTRIEGHRAGLDNIRRIVKFFADNDVSYLTVYAFSTENWGRPDDEVEALMGFLAQAVRDETPRLHSQGVRINHLGRLDRLPDELQHAITESIELTKDNEVLTLCIAYDYGGRTEIVDAVKLIVSDCIQQDQITEEVICRNLYTRNLPDPDLVIRTAGEMRLSNFLLWQSAYAEFYSTNVCWPDFDEMEARKALISYSQRKRRYGKLELG